MGGFARQRVHAAANLKSTHDRKLVKPARNLVHEAEAEETAAAAEAENRPEVFAVEAGRAVELVLLRNLPEVLRLFLANARHVRTAALVVPTPHAAVVLPEVNAQRDADAGFGNDDRIHVENALLDLLQMATMCRAFRHDELERDETKLAVLDRRPSAQMSAKRARQNALAATTSFASQKWPLHKTTGE